LQDALSKNKKKKNNNNKDKDKDKDKDSSTDKYDHNTSAIPGVLSVHGVLRVRKGGLALSGESSAASAASTTKACVEAMNQGWELLALEACASCVLLRPLGDTALAGSRVDVVTLVGVLTAAVESQAVGLVQKCASPFLPRLPVLTASAVSHAQRLGIQRQPANAAKPLPDGWWFDGSSYLDMYGTRRTLRPDIDAMVGVHMELVNARIVRHNALLDRAG
jgi:hypothetical protein